MGQYVLEVTFTIYSGIIEHSLKTKATHRLAQTKS